MRFFVKNGSTTSGFYRAWLGTRAEYDTAMVNLPNGTLVGITDEAETSIDLGTVYPVGSIYMNATDDTNPNTLFGIGTWGLIDSKFLYGTNSLLSDLGDTGGADIVTLTQANLPATATFTIPALDLSIDSASTAHTHSTTKTTGTTGNVSGSGDTWKHRHSPLVYTGRQKAISNVYGYSLLASNQGGEAEGLGYASKMTYMGGNNFYIDEANLQHTHDFTIPALTTGGMSANETHTHTGSTTATSVNITDFGSGAAFSILPTYRKVAIWYRTN